MSNRHTSYIQDITNQAKKIGKYLLLDDVIILCQNRKWFNKLHISNQADLANRIYKEAIKNISNG